VNLADAQFFLGGGAGNSELELPPDVGLRIPELANPGFWLEVHYFNVTDKTQEDASSLELCVSSRPRAHEAAVHALGKADFTLPAKTQSSVAATCHPSRLKEPVHIIGISPHMHATGSRATLQVNHQGAEATTVFDEPFDVQEQHNYVVPTKGLTSDIVLAPGDTLTTSCKFDNSTGATIHAGPSSEEEMCLMLVWAWPAQQLNNGLFVSPNLGILAEEDCREP